MEYLLNYLNFNESKGISDSCEYVLYDIWKEIKNDIETKTNGIYKLDINRNDFKIKDLEIKYEFSIGHENNCYGLSNLKDFCIELDINVNYMDDEFIYYIKTVLFHEILYIFQYYNLKINNKFRPESFSIGSILPQLRKIIKTDYGNYILLILYNSLSHEISAQLHQYYMYRISGKEYKRIFQIRDNLDKFIIKELNDNEYKEIEKIKNYISNSIKYNKYINNVEKSLWDERKNK